jgi:hypothetical protein
VETRCKELVGWFGFAATYLGVGLQAFYPALTRYSFPVFIVAATVWATYALANRDRPLFFKNLGLVVINVIAVIRWFT